jgi:hypothetical protein
MLPVGEAETVGANINTNTDRRVHKIEDVDRFIAASVGIAECPFFNRDSGIPSPLRLLSQTGLNLNQKYHLKITGNPFATS